MCFDLKVIKLNKENIQVEAKSAKNSLPDNVWETYSSFENIKGSQILLGLSEEKNTGRLVVIGIDNPKKVSKNSLNNSDFSEIALENGKVFVIHVPKAPLKLRPIYMEDNLLSGSSKRNTEGDYHCTKDDISTMLREAHTTSYNSEVISDYPLSILSSDSVRKFRRYHEVNKPKQPWIKLNNDEFLMMIESTDRSELDGLICPTQHWQVY